MNITSEIIETGKDIIMYSIIYVKVETSREIKRKCKSGRI